MKKYLFIALFVSAQAESNSFLQKIDKDQDILLLALKEVNGKSIDVQKIRKNTVTTHTLEELFQMKKRKKEKNTIKKNKVTKKEVTAIIVNEIKNVNSMSNINKIKHSSIIKDKGLKEVRISTSHLNKSNPNISLDQEYRDAVREME